jgi:hypothetical protein
MQSLIVVVVGLRDQVSRVIYEAVVVYVTFATMIASSSGNEERSVAGNRRERKNPSLREQRTRKKQGIARNRTRCEKVIALLRLASDSS